MLTFIYCLCFVILLLIMWAVLIPAGTFARGYLLGVKLPKAAETDHDFTALAKAYKKSAYYTMASCILIFLPVFYLIHVVSFQLLYFLTIYIAECVLFEVPYILYHQKVRDLKVAKGYDLQVTYQDLSEDENNWKWGIFYFNPNDERKMVSKRVGIGMSINYAHTNAKNWIIGMVMLVILPLIACLMPIFIHEFSTPTLEIVEADTVKIDCFEYGTTFDLDDVVKLELVDSLPNGTKINGIATTQIARGHFAFKGMGRGMAYVYVDTPPYLLITFEESYIIYNEPNAEQTKAVYEQLLSQAKTLE